MPVSVPAGHSASEGIGPVELGLDHEEAFFGRGVDLDGLDAGRGGHDAQTEAARGVDDLGGGLALSRALEVDEAIVEVEIPHLPAARHRKVVRGPPDGHHLAGRQHLVIVVDRGAAAGRDVEAGLLAPAARQVEVGVPADPHREDFVAHVANIDRDHPEGEGVAPQHVLPPDLRSKGPAAAEVAGVQDAAQDVGLRRGLALLPGHRGVEQQAMHGVLLGAGPPAAGVGGQMDGVARELGLDGPAVVREPAADAVGVGQQQRAADPVGMVAGERLGLGA